MSEIFSQTSTSIMRYAVIGVLFVIEFVFSLNMNCTNLTKACPTAAQWSARGNSFNCSGNKRYVCLMASKTELREGCIFDSTIPAGRIGCPYTKQCDRRTNQPLLVTENKYLSCPPDLNGCPTHNHSGYSILHIYKYPRCQGKNISEESSVSHKKTPDTTTGIIAICIIVWVITASVTAVFIRFRGRCQQSGDAVKVKFNANSPESNDIFYTKDGNEKSSINSLEEHSKDFPVFNDAIYTNDGRFSSQSLEGHSKDLNTEYMGYNVDVDFTAKAVNPLYGNGVLSEQRQNNSRKEKPENHFSARQQSYQINQDTLQTSLADVTIETEEQDIIEEMVNLTSSRKKDLLEVLHSRSPSCSSSGSDRSQTPMLKVISKTLPLSPQTLPKQVQSLYF